MEVKYFKNRAADQIIRLVSQKNVPSDSYIDAIPGVPCREESSFGVLPALNQKFKKTPNNKGFQCYCVLWKKTVIHERKYKSHTLGHWFGRVSNQESIKEGLGGKLGNRDKAFKPL